MEVPYLGDVAPYRAAIEKQLGLRCSKCGERLDPYGWEAISVTFVVGEDGKPKALIDNAYACPAINGCTQAVDMANIALVVREVRWTWMAEAPEVAHNGDAG